jgi:predicted TIM-barrel fold metal-dependent hydrolase
MLAIFTSCRGPFCVFRRQALKAIYAANPQALMFGTDLPSTRAPRPFETNDISILVDALGDKGAELALWTNAASFYRLPS